MSGGTSSMPRVQRLASAELAAFCLAGRAGHTSCTRDSLRLLCAGVQSRELDRVLRAVIAPRQLPDHPAQAGRGRVGDQQVHPHPPLCPLHGALHAALAGRVQSASMRISVSVVEHSANLGWCSLLGPLIMAASSAWDWSTQIQHVRHLYLQHEPLERAGASIISLCT